MTESFYAREIDRTYPRMSQMLVELQCDVIHSDMMRGGDERAARLTIPTNQTKKVKFVHPKHPPSFLPQFPRFRNRQAENEEVECGLGFPSNSEAFTKN